MITITQFISLTIVTMLLMIMVSCSSSTNKPSTNPAVSLKTENSSSDSPKKVSIRTDFDLKTIAKSIGEASTKIAKSFKLSFKEQSVTQMVLSVKNVTSGKNEEDAKWIEAELYYAFEQNLPDSQILVLKEAVAGIP